jgi:hypothetical protein
MLTFISRDFDLAPPTSFFRFAANASLAAETSETITK